MRRLAIEESWSGCAAHTEKAGRRGPGDDPRARWHDGVRARGTPQSIAVFGSNQAVDVTGAGDTVIAAFTLALAAGASVLEAAQIANYAGGIVVMKRGTATVTHAELLGAINARRTADRAAGWRSNRHGAGLVDSGSETAEPQRPRARGISLEHVTGGRTDRAKWRRNRQSIPAKKLWIAR